MDAHRPFTAEIAALHAACRARLESGLPTHLRRSDYHEALDLADAALQLAADAALDAEVVAKCEQLQERCENALRGWYSVLDQREKEHYERAVAAVQPAGASQERAREDAELCLVVGACSRRRWATLHQPHACRETVDDHEPESPPFDGHRHPVQKPLDSDRAGKVNKREHCM